MKVCFMFGVATSRLFQIGLSINVMNFNHHGLDIATSIGLKLQPDSRWASKHALSDPRNKHK